MMCPGGAGRSAVNTRGTRTVSFTLWVRSAGAAAASTPRAAHSTTDRREGIVLSDDEEREEEGQRLRTVTVDK